MMRRIFFLVLLVGLVLSVMPDASGKTNTQSIDVTAKSTTTSVTPICYSVDILWTDMNFTYVQEKTHIWNATNHSYRTSTRGSWENNQSTITVINHSNVDIEVKITFTPMEGTGITGVLKNGSGKLKAGIPGEFDSADSMTATLTVRGTPTDAVTAAGIKVGTVLVAIQ